MHLEVSTRPRGTQRRDPIPVSAALWTRSVINRAIVYPYARHHNLSLKLLPNILYLIVSYRDSQTRHANQLKILVSMEQVA